MYDKEGLGVKTVTYMDNQDCIGENVQTEVLVFRWKHWHLTNISLSSAAFVIHLFLSTFWFNFFFWQHFVFHQASLSTFVRPITLPVAFLTSRCDRVNFTKEILNKKGRKLCSKTCPTTSATCMLLHVFSWAKNLCIESCHTAPIKQERLMHFLKYGLKKKKNRQWHEGFPNLWYLCLIVFSH